MAKNKATYAVANNIKQLNIQKDTHMIYKQDLYKKIKRETQYLFLEYLVPIVYYLEHPELIEEWKQHLDAAAYEKSIQICKVTIN